MQTGKDNVRSTSLNASCDFHIRFQLCMGKQVDATHMVNPLCSHQKPWARKALVFVDVCATSMHFNTSRSLHKMTIIQGCKTNLSALRIAVSCLLVFFDLMNPVSFHCFCPTNKLALSLIWEQDGLTCLMPTFLGL